MITYLIIGITVVLSFICFSNRELFMKLAFIPYRTIRQVSGDYQRLAYIINDYQGVHFERLSF